jgi:hypothetical protein
MDEKQRRFRFGLISLFALVAAVGVLAFFWNPFPKPNKSNIEQVELGMSERDVAKLIGPADSTSTAMQRPHDESAPTVHTYLISAKEQWDNFFVKGCVVRSYRRQSSDDYFPRPPHP